MEKIEVKFKDEMPFSIKALNIGKYPIHWHEGVTEILLPIKGSIEVVANFEHILVKEGDFWFINNKTIHSIESQSKSTVIMLHIDLNYFEKFFGHIKYMFFRNNMYSKGRVKTESDNYDDEIRKGYKVRFRNLMISVITDAISSDSLDRELILDSIYQLVASMVKEFNWLQFLKKSSDFISPFQLDRYHRIVKYIDEHYNEKITLDDIAKREYITQNYFSHFWKDLSNFSFKERLNYERVLKSEFLLLTTDMSIADIAEKCGFSDVKYYYKHFKKWYGLSPTEHRKKCLSYMKGKFDYDEVNLQDIKDIIDSYIKNIVMEEYAQNNLWKTTSLFDNFVRMKYLYKVDKINPQRAPKNVVIDLFSPHNFRIKDNIPYFNWQNIDMLVNFTETSDFDINIKLDCRYLDEQTSKDAIYDFIKLSIYRYRLVTIKKWKFFICYYDDSSLYQANTIGDIISKKIPDAQVIYFFEI